MHGKGSDSVNFSNAEKNGLIAVQLLCLVQPGRPSYEDAASAYLIYYNPA